MAELHVVRVFTDHRGRYGNPLGVFLDGQQVPVQARARVAAHLNFSETVLVESLVGATLTILTPVGENKFAGHPLVGTSWLLSQVGRRASVLRPPAGEVQTWIEEGLTWIRGRPEWSPPWESEQLKRAEDVGGLVGPPSPAQDFNQFWAWQDEARGLVRARVFAGREGAPEDEACGSASMLLAHRLQRSITILHGAGSLIHARPGPGGTAEVGGLVCLDRIVDYPLP